MAKSSPNRFAEPKIIGTEAEARQYANRMSAVQSASNNEPKTKKFDPEKYFQEELEKSQAEKERRISLEARFKEYSLPWDFKSKTPPFPGMVLNPCFVRWEPENIEDFIREHGEEFKKYKSAGLTNQSGKQSSEKSPKSDNGQATIMTTVARTPNPAEPPKSAKPPKNEAQTKPIVIPKKTAPPKVKEEIKTAGTPPEASTKEVETLPEVVTVTESTIMTEPDEVESRQKSAHATTTTKATRISAKMRRASRQEFHDAYLVKADTKGGKPITISVDLIRRLYRICARSGDYRTCPTYLANNLLSEILDIIEPETEGWVDLD